jgi:hypothetical protein
MALAPSLSRPFDTHTGDAEAEPPSATGQYPGPVWADEATASSAGLALEDEAADDAPVPPSATGQYPGPVWADEESNGTAAAAALASPDSAPPPLGLKEDETAADATRDAAPVPSPSTELTNEGAYGIIRVVAEGHTGDQLYTAVSPDLEFATDGNPAFGRRHFGLGFGLVLFGQASGLLGRVLELTRARNAAAFAEVFGPQADELLAVTTAATEDARLASVGGDLLWAPAWIDRFRAAGALPECQAAQNETAIEAQFLPMARIAVDLGLDTDRSLAMAYDAVVARGLDAGLRWLAAVAGPIGTAAQRDGALASLGYTDLGAFQIATGLPLTNGELDPVIHAALVGAIRRRGLLAPTAGDLECRMIRGASGPARIRLERLHRSDAFDDVARSIAPATTPGG